MSTIEESVTTAPGSPPPLPTDMRLEVIVLPVSDVDRALAFYRSLDWRVDAEFSDGAGYRIAQLTPPGSACSIIFGSDVSTATPGSVEGLHLAVLDLDQTRAELVGRGIEVSEVFHDAGGVFHHAGNEARVPGPDPEGRSYCSFASFADPDGNSWILQEIQVRLPGR